MRAQARIIVAAIAVVLGLGAATAPSPTVGAAEDAKKAIRDGLLWLCRHQDPSGCWAGNGLAARCTSGTRCWPPTIDVRRNGEAGHGKEIPRTAHYDPGLTGLAALAFLGAGIVPGAKVELADPQLSIKHDLGARLESALAWLVAQQQPNGAVSEFGFLYNEAIAASALAEASRCANGEKWKDAARKSIRYVIAAQKDKPEGSGKWGWRYFSAELLRQRSQDGTLTAAELAAQLHDADMSVTVWCVKALESARAAGIDVPADTLAGARAYLDFATQRGVVSADAKGKLSELERARAIYTGLVGYQGADRAGEIVTGPRDRFTYYPETMTALGMCTRLALDHDWSDPFLLVGADALSKRPPSAQDEYAVDYYYWHHATLALNRYDGPKSPLKRRGTQWNAWQKQLGAELLPLQDQTEKKRVCSRGGWLELDRWSYSGGPIYTTALNVLTLELVLEQPLYKAPPGAK